MATKGRANWFRVLLVSASVTSLACQSNPTAEPKHDGATGGSGGNAGSGGVGSGGNSGSGGVAGTSGSGGTGGRTGSGGAATGGSGGKTGGASGSGGGGGGGSTGNGGASGSGGASPNGGSSGKGGAGGAGGASASTSKSDGGVPDRFDAAADQVSRDLPSTSDILASDSACAEGQALCGATCVDITTTAHCGGCSVACGSSQTCLAGVCVEGGNTDGDGCTSDLARDLTLQQIAIYQTVKIPVMEDGSEIATASRMANVIQGRNTLFRVFVTLGSGWNARELAARLTVTPSDGPAAQYYSRKTISASSKENDPKTTFQIFVPPDAMTGSLRYSVEVVECSTQSGTAGQARFPASGDIDLGVKNTGGLKIKIIPIQFNSLLPDTSPTALAIYADEVAAEYPVNDVSITVGDSLTAASPIDWSGMLDQVRAKRNSDKPTADVYYYGLIKPADTLRAYCQSSCTTGIGFVVTSATGTTAGSGRAAVGVGFADKTSAQTMTHEVGHNHGRNHSPCSTAGSISNVDPKYPYTSGVIGSWGYDYRTQTLLDPAKYTDIMGYCSNKWMSDYTYGGITTRVAAVNGVTMMYTPNYALARWRILLVDDAHGPRWGIPITDEVPAEGDPETATIYDRTGAALTNVTVYRTAIGDIAASMYMVPEPQSGWYAVAPTGVPPLPFQ